VDFPTGITVRVSFVDIPSRLAAIQISPSPGAFPINIRLLQEPEGRRTAMYLYDDESLSECNVTGKWARLGPGIDPIGAEKQLCPLIQDKTSGRFTDWTDYILRIRDLKDPRSKFKAFRNERLLQGIH
jgi:hypothetical protein